MTSTRWTARARRVLGAPLRSLTTAARVELTVRTHRTFALPILMFSPTSRCNSRCVSCDFWRTDGASDLRADEVGAIVRELPALRTKLVVFTGGEPLLRADVFDLADRFLEAGVALHLLTSGLALERHADAVARRFSGVTVSLDGHTPELYQAIRGVDGLGAVERGVRALKRLRPSMPVRARSTLHRRNFRALPDLIAKAESMGLDQISFLAADVTSESFGRSAAGALPTADTMLLDEAEATELDRVIDEACVHHARAFREGKVAESLDKLRRLPAYYRGHLGSGPFPRVECNAPWVSAVVEADGSVRPCFFLAPVGNVRERSLGALLQSEMVQARRRLSVKDNPTCQRCVCSLRHRSVSPLA